MFAQRFDASASPVGPEFRVNESEEGHQFHPSIAMTDDGGFAAAYHVAPEDQRDFEVMARRFDANGDGSSEFQMNEHDAAAQKLVRIAALPGGFVAVWESYNQDESAYGIFARRYDQQQDAQEWQVAVPGDRWETTPDVAAGPDGRVVVVWYVDDLMGGWDIQARVFGPR